jgi:dTDP-4-amino-4,6-dideoxygalactose transaminase
MDVADGADGELPLEAKVVELGRPTFGPEEVEAVREVLASGWVAGQGPQSAVLEARFGALTERKYAIAVSNCTAALHLAMIAFDVSAGDEILVADYTYPATGHAVLYAGGSPVFVDVDVDTGNIDPEACLHGINERTRGIIAVDAFGQCAPYGPLRQIADDNELFLVEDAAPAAGAMQGGKPAGSFGDIACFSLHGRKGITSGEGGIFVTDDRDVYSRARSLSAFGVESAWERQSAHELPIPVFAELGYNYKMSDIQAAIAIVQVDRLKGFIARRSEIADLYQDRLESIDGITPPMVAPGNVHSWQAYVVRVDPDLSRDRIAMYLRKRGVQSNIGTFALHLQPIYGGGEDCPVSAQLFAGHLAIPMHVDLTKEEIESVAETLREAVEAA